MNANHLLQQQCLQLFQAERSIQTSNMNCISSNLFITLWVCVCVHVLRLQCEGLNLKSEKRGKQLLCGLLLNANFLHQNQHYEPLKNIRHKWGEMLHFYLLTMKHLIMDSSRIRHLFLPANNSHVQISLGSNTFSFLKSGILKLSHLWNIHYIFKCQSFMNQTETTS